MGRNRLFQTVKAATEYVITKKGLGCRTSVRELGINVLQHMHESRLETLYSQTRAQLLDRYKNGRVNSCTPMYGALTGSRSLTRQKLGESAVDCRTYNGQPRRNMFDDSKLHISVLGKLQTLLEGINANEWMEALKGFHSIDQLRNAIQHTEELSTQYDLVSV